MRIWENESMGICEKEKEEERGEKRKSVTDNGRERKREEARHK